MTQCLECWVTFCQWPSCVSETRQQQVKRCWTVWLTINFLGPCYKLDSHLFKLTGSISSKRVSGHFSSLQSFLCLIQDKPILCVFFLAHKLQKGLQALLYLVFISDSSSLVVRIQREEVLAKWKIENLRLGLKWEDLRRTSGNIEAITGNGQTSQAVQGKNQSIPSFLSWIEVEWDVLLILGAKETQPRRIIHLPFNLQVLLTRLRLL